MGWIKDTARKIQKHFERTASHELKKHHKTLHTTFKIFDALENPKTKDEQEKQRIQNQCLEAFRELKADVDGIFEKHPLLEDAAGKPDKSRDGWRAGLSTLPVVGTCYAFLSAFDGTSMPLLASTIIIGGMIGGVAAVGLCAVTVGYFVLSRNRAHTLGLTASDVKYAKKLDHMRLKLACRINKLDNMDPLTEHLEQIGQKYEKTNKQYKDSLHKKFNVLSGKRKNIPAVVQVQKPAVEVKPIKKNDSLAEIARQLDAIEPKQKKGKNTAPTAA